MTGDEDMHTDNTRCLGSQLNDSFYQVGLTKLPRLPIGTSRVLQPVLSSSRGNRSMGEPALNCLNKTELMKQKEENLRNLR